MDKTVYSHRKAAFVVGLLFLIALFFNIIAMAIYEPILSAPDYLSLAFQKKITVIVGLILDFICIPAIVLIPIVAYPLLKKHSESLALGYVAFRIFEGTLFAASVICSLSLVSLSKEFIATGTRDTSFISAIGTSIQYVNHWITLIYIIVFTLGALIFYYNLYSSLLLPRFISIWGLGAALFLLTGALIGMFDIFPLKKVMTVFSPPFILNELTLSVWLIAKGFNTLTADYGGTKKSYINCMDHSDKQPVDSNSKNLE